MKIRFFLPLLLFVLLTWLPLVAMSPPDYLKIIQYSVFVCSFSLTYMFGIKESINNRDAVVKMKQKSPALTPIAIFTGSSLVSTAIIIPRDREIILQFAVCFIFAILVYFMAILLVNRQLKKEFAVEKPAAPRQGVRTLVLINPVNKKRDGLTNSVSSRFPPLGLGIIAALTPEERYDIKIIDENFDEFKYEEADLVGITAFTSAALRAYEIAAMYREKGIPVVMGGIHVSMVPDEAARYADSIVIGEAESVWPGLIDDFEHNRLKPEYRAELLELNNMVVPRRDLFHPGYMFTSIQTSRGCPMDCNFCSVTPFNGRKYRQRPVQDVLGELGEIKGQYLFFIDDNIIGYSREHKQHALELFRGMVERKMNKRWFCQASLNFGEDEEVLAWAHRAGCRMVFLGLESPEHEDLKEMNKKLNLKLEYGRILKNINRHKITVLGAFITGTDNETAATMQRKADYILHSNIDVIQTTILTPLPGTRLFRQFCDNGRLLYGNFPADWEKYDMSEITFKLKKMETGEFALLNSQNVGRYYSRFNMIRMFIRTMLHTRSIECAMWAYSSNCNYRAVSFGKA
ncbi:MAG: B12-binding domain-containing radical SAM protein [Spirochaetales bacterium]|nr:B12-binding domain-containing radical SAM protein [Spirochaetales bacterium]